MGALLAKKGDDLQIFSNNFSGFICCPKIHVWCEFVQNWFRVLYARVGYEHTYRPIDKLFSQSGYYSRKIKKNFMKDHYTFSTNIVYV